MCSRGPIRVRSRRRSRNAHTQAGRYLPIPGIAAGRFSVYRGDMANPRHVHSSSRYDASLAALDQQVSKVSTHEDPSANLYTLTEIGTAERAAQCEADGWGHFHPHDKTDCAVMWRKSRWEKIETSTRRLTDKTWVVSGHTHKLVAAAVVLGDTESNRRLWVAVVHFPSGVQSGHGWATDNDDAVAAWQSGIKGLKEYRTDQKNQYGIDCAMLCADWNVNFKIEYFRDYVRNVFDQMTCTWQKPYPNGGTHGDRLIDATWTDGVREQDAWLLKDDDSSDHRPYADIVTWKND